MKKMHIYSRNNEIAIMIIDRNKNIIHKDK